MGKKERELETLQVTSLSHAHSLTHAHPLTDPHTHLPSLTNALSHTLAAGVTSEVGGQLGKKEREVEALQVTILLDWVEFGGYEPLFPSFCV